MAVSFRGVFEFGDQVRRGRWVFIAGSAGVHQFTGNTPGGAVPPLNQGAQSRDGSATFFTPEQLTWLHLIKDHVATAISIEADDFDYAPIVQKGGLGRAHQLFGDELLPLLDELNHTLAAGPKSSPKRDPLSQPRPTIPVWLAALASCSTPPAAPVCAGNAFMTATYWEIGRRIVGYKQGGETRAGYGEELLARLADDLNARFGRGFSRQNLQRFRQFYSVSEVCIQH